MADTPFESIESAHEYVTLLVSQVDEVERALAQDLVASAESSDTRQLDALRLVDYKLSQLGNHLAISARILNDLRALRRLLLAERRRDAAPAGASQYGGPTFRLR